jgi:multidrug efflux pump subunit AcrB
MLIGLSSKNAILIVEFANQLRQQGMTLQDAVVEAAQIRLRPILMTSLAFIIGILPLMLSEGAGSGSRHSLSIGVFGGMVFSTVFSLYVIPVFYILVNQTHQRLGRWLRGKDDLMTATHSV